jgi:hypothetical protein
MRIVPAHWWTWSTAALAASLALGLSWCIVRSPLTLYDGLGPILDSHRASSVQEMFEGAFYSAGYWRPLRLTQIKLVVDAWPDATAAFKAIHVVLTFSTFLLFVAWLRPRSLPEFTAAAIAIMILAGHHSFFILFGEAYPINHFLEIVALTLAIAALARGEPRWWKDVLAPVLLVVGALTLESGLLIGVAAIVCWVLGWRGISLRGIAAVAVVLVAYFGVRFLVLEIPSPGLDERATGWGFTHLEPRELLDRFGANPLPFYAYNVTSALLGVLLSEPRGGSWGFTESVLINHDVKPWMIMHIAASLIVTGAMLAALPPAASRWRRGCLNDRDRFLLAALALVAANSVLSFGYVKDEVLSVGAAFYGAGAFAALADLGDRVRARGRACTAAAVLLVCASVLWSTRAAGTFFALQTFAYKTATDWALYSLESELPADWAFEPTRRAFFELRRRNLGREVPHPVFTKQERVERYLELR